MSHNLPAAAVQRVVHHPRAIRAEDLHLLTHLLRDARARHHRFAAPSVHLLAKFDSVSRSTAVFDADDNASRRLANSRAVLSDAEASRSAR